MKRVFFLIVLLLVTIVSFAQNSKQRFSLEGSGTLKTISDSTSRVVFTPTVAIHLSDRWELGFETPYDSISKTLKVSAFFRLAAIQYHRVSVKLEFGAEGYANKRRIKDYEVGVRPSIFVRPFNEGHFLLFAKTGYIGFKNNQQYSNVSYGRISAGIAYSF